MKLIIKKIFMLIHCTIKDTLLVALLRRLVAEHSYTPVSSLYAPVKIKSTVTLVTFPSLVDIDILVMDTLSLNDPLNFLH